MSTLLMAFISHVYWQSSTGFPLLRPSGLIFRGLLSVPALLLFLSCGQAKVPFALIDASSTTCIPGVAEILVGDGFLQILCGCTLPTEAAGSIFPPPGGLTCHLPTRESVVFFYFFGAQNKHQIVPLVEGSFPSSPISDPTQESPIRAYSLQFSTPSSVYGFEDAFTGLTGQIILPE